MEKMCASIEDRIKFDEPMKQHTSLKIGGTADLFFTAKTQEEVFQAIKYSKKNNLKLYIIGNGSNVLIADKGIRGFVLKIDIQKKDITYLDKYVELTVGSGNKLMALAIEMKNKSISGLEEFSGIPGTIGGAIYMNAGAYGKEIKDILISTKCMDRQGNIFTLDNKNHNFGYRTSIFNEKEYIILETKLKLQISEKEIIEEKMSKYLQSRKEKQPLEYPSAGSTFKRCEGFITAKLIDECGLKGYMIGGAQISDKHAGFIINKSNATAKDVIDLIEYVKKKVFEKYGIKIEEEIKLMGDI